MIDCIGHIFVRTGIIPSISCFVTKSSRVFNGVFTRR